MSLYCAARPHLRTSAPSAPSSLLFRTLQISYAPQRISYRWKALALRFTMMLLALAELADDHFDETLIATIPHTFAETASMTLATTALARVKDIANVM